MPIPPKNISHNRGHEAAAAVAGLLKTAAEGVLGALQALPGELQAR